MIKKIILTIVCAIMPVASLGVALSLFTGDNGIIDILKNMFQGKEIGKGILGLFTIFFMLAPGWYLWKGTKVIPVIFILPIRIVLFVAALFLAPVAMFLTPTILDSETSKILVSVGGILLVFLTLWGIWVRS